MSRARLFSEEAMCAFLARIRDCNRGAGFRRTHVPFVIGEKTYGFVTQQDYERLTSFPSVFVPSSDGRALRLTREVERLELAGRTDVVEGVMRELRLQGILKKRYNEYFPVCETFSTPPVLLVDRSVYGILGIRGYGVHINGFVKSRENPAEHKIWVAKRSATKSTYPNKFDCLVGGGQPYGISLMENVVKECMEEASIPDFIARRAICTGATAYTDADEASGRLGRDILFCYDLELEEDFVPRPSDGEVQSFELKSIDWVVDTIIRRSDQEFKPNINLTTIDFLVRHGYICNSSPRYLELLSALRGGDCL